MPETLQRINISDVENEAVVCFDTGLDSRSFARAKMSRSLVETGYVVHSDGSCETWKPSGVNEINGFMQIWGPLFTATRLDTYLSPQAEQQTALEAVAFWIRAKLFLGDKHSALNPGAAFINSNGSVFFAPEELSNHSLFTEGMELDRYNCPDLTGMAAAAFCAGVMLYTILAKAHPYPASDIYQDMKEGVFLPVHIAIPNLNKKLSGLIQAALLLPVKNSGAEILGDLLKILISKENIFRTLTGEESEQLNKEKELYLLKKKTVVKAARYVTQNKLFLTVIAAALLFVIFLAGSLIRGRLERPTTEGLSSYAVVAAYYDAFNSLDHIFMEVCLMGADKNDVNLVLNLFLIDRVRQAYEHMTDTSFIPAETWRQQGEELPPENVFGILDLIITHTGGSEIEGEIQFRAEYLLLHPHEPDPFSRSDTLRLKQDRRNNWRITEIRRGTFS
jgi:hypothetical protein